MSENGQSYSKTMRIDLLPVLDGSGDGQHRLRIDSDGSSQERLPASELKGGAHTPYEQLLQSIYDGVMVSTMDGTIVEVNRRLLDFLRAPRERVLQMKVFDVLSGSDPSLIETLREHMASQSFAVIQAYCIRIDQSVFPAEIAVNDLSSNGTQQLCFFVRDVTLRRQQQQMLWTEHNAIQNSGSGIAVAGLDGRLEYANPSMAAMWGCLSGDELVGRQVHHLFRDEVAADAMTAAVLASQKTWVGQLVARRKDGREVHVQVSAGCNRLSEGDVVGLVLSFIDITDKIRADLAVRETERQRVMLESLGAACHHLGQPATVLFANLELMQHHLGSGPNGTAELAPLIDSSLQATHRMGRILHRLNSVNEYKTTVYTQPEASEEATGATRILDIEAPSPS